MGATQQEQSINGAPVAPAIICALSDPFPNARTSQRGDTNVVTAPLIRIPKNNAGQMTKK
jgi:hypothetical protein